MGKNWRKFKWKAKLHTRIGNIRGPGQCCLIYITRGPRLDSNVGTHADAHTGKQSGETEMQDWLKQHIPLIFAFPADAGTFKCYQGSCSEHAANFHPHPPQPCTFLPRQQGGQVFCTQRATTPALAARRSRCQARLFRYTDCGHVYTWQKQ